MNTNMNEQLKAWNEKQAEERRVNASAEVRKQAPISGIYDEGEAHQDYELDFDAKLKWFAGWIREPLDALVGMETPMRRETIDGEMTVMENVRAREMISSVLNHLHYTGQMMDRWMAAALTRVEAASRGDVVSEIGVRKLEGAIDNLRRTTEAFELNREFLKAGIVEYDAVFSEPWSPRVAKSERSATGEQYLKADPAVQALLAKARGLVSPQKPAKPRLDPAKLAEALEQSARKRTGVAAERSIDDHEEALNRSAA